MGIQVSRMATVNHSVYRAVVTAKAMQSVIAECTCFINATLSKWNGVKESKRLKTQILEFRKYFAVSKNWFDQIKLEHMALHFWMPIFSLVETVAGKAAGEFFSHRLYAHQALYGRYLNMLILENLLRGTLKIANSRERLLIPAGAFRTLKKNVPLFKPRPLPHGQSPTGRRKKGKKATSKETREQILQCVVQTASASKREFQEKLYALHEEVDHYQAMPTPTVMHTLQAPAMTHPSCCSLKMCNRDVDELDFGDVGMADMSMASIASPSVSLPSYSMDAPSPLPQQQPQPANIHCNQNIPMSYAMRHSNDSISHSTDNLVKDVYMPNEAGAFSKSPSIPMAELYQKPEMPQIPQIPQIPEMYSKHNKHLDLAWKQPLSGNSSEFNPFSSNNSYTAYNSSSASAYQSNYSR